MNQLPASPSQGNDDLISSITFKIDRDPVLTGDGHIHKRNTIGQWIETQGTSPITRRSMSIDDCQPMEYTKQVCQQTDVHPITYYIDRHSTALSSSSTFDSDDHGERKTTFKQNWNSKRVILVILVICFILVSLLVVTSILLSRYRFSSISTDAPSFTRNPRNITHAPTRYLLPNNCTLSRIVSLFSWDNARSFNFTYFSRTYQAMSNKTILTFAFRHSPSYWCLDNATMIDTSSNTDIIINGHFDNKPSDGFIRCNAFANTSTTSFMPPPYSFTVQRSFCDGSVGLPDYLSQTLNTKIGQMYQISFWLKNGGNAPNGARVVMSY